MIHSPNAEGQNTRSGPVHTTMATKALIDALTSNGRSYVLDLGCLCDTNIQFFLELGCRVFVDDIFQLNVKIPRRARAPQEVWIDAASADLAYPPNFFDAIVCWDLFDHLDKESTKRLSHKLWTILKISGYVMALFRPEGSGLDAHAFRYRIMNHGELSYETLPLPPYQGMPYQNRDIAGLVTPLSLGNSYRLKNGWREVLLRK